MTRRPHDTIDLMLAPAALSVDARLEDLGALSADELDATVALEANVNTSSLEARRRGLLTSVTRFVELHGWAVAWDRRGLRLSHADRTLVLGLPPTLADYVSASELSAEVSPGRTAGRG